MNPQNSSHEDQHLDPPQHNDAQVLENQEENPQNEFYYYRVKVPLKYSLGLWLGSIFTFGILFPKLYCKYWKAFFRRASFGGKKIVFTGTGKDLFKKLRLRWSTLQLAKWKDTHLHWEQTEEDANEGGDGVDGEFVFFQVFPTGWKRHFYFFANWASGNLLYPLIKTEIEANCLTTARLGDKKLEFFGTAHDLYPIFVINKALNTVSLTYWNSCGPGKGQIQTWLDDHLRWYSEDQAVYDPTAYVANNEASEPVNMSQGYNYNVN